MKNCLLIAVGLLSVGKLHASEFNLIEDNTNKTATPDISNMRALTKPIDAPAVSFASFEQQEEAAMPESAPSYVTGIMASPANSIVLPSSSGAAIGGIRPSKRSRSENEGNDRDLESFISSEINYSVNIIGREKAVLRKVIEFIAHNDYTGFMDYESEFEATFNHKYDLFKRGPTKTDFMMHYITRFGATQFLNDPVYGNPVSAGSNVEEAYEHLIATKPLDVVLVFIKSSRHLKNESIMKVISRAVQKYHPNLHFLDYMVFESQYLGTRSSHLDETLKIFEAKTEEMKFELLTEFFNNSKDRPFANHFSQLRFLKIPFLYENYFLSIDVQIKYFLAKLAVINDYTEALSTIFKLVPNLADDNLLMLATQWEKLNCLGLLVEIVPELVSLETLDKLSPFAYSIKLEKIKTLTVFEASGVDLMQEILFQGRKVKPIQLALEMKNPKSFEFILNKIGVENVLQTLLQVYGSRNEIMSRAMRPIASFELVLILSQRLGFNLKDSYTFEGKTGNVLVFTTEVGYRLDLLKYRLCLF